MRFNRRLGDYAGLKTIWVKLKRVLPGDRLVGRHAHLLSAS